MWDESILRKSAMKYVLSKAFKSKTLSGYFEHLGTFNINLVA